VKNLIKCSVSRQSECNFKNCIFKNSQICIVSRTCDTYYLYLPLVHIQNIIHKVNVIIPYTVLWRLTTDSMGNSFLRISETLLCFLWKLKIYHIIYFCINQVFCFSSPNYRMFFFSWSVKSSTCPAHLSLFDFIKQRVFREE
jgi:hypothetical protein